MGERPSEGISLMDYHKGMREYYRKRREYYIKLAKIRQIQSEQRNARHRYREAED